MQSFWLWNRAGISILSCQIMLAFTKTRGSNAMFRVKKQFLNTIMTIKQCGIFKMYQILLDKRMNTFYYERDKITLNSILKYIEISISSIWKYDIIGLLRTKLLTFKVMNSLKSFQFFFNRTQMLAIQFVTAFLYKNNCNTQQL